MKKKQNSRGKTQASGKNKADECLLELSGNVYVVEKKNGKEVSRGEIDGTVVLQCLMSHLKEGLGLLEKKSKLDTTFVDENERW